MRATNRQSKPQEFTARPIGEPFKIQFRGGRPTPISKNLCSVQLHTTFVSSIHLALNDPRPLRRPAMLKKTILAVVAVIAVLLLGFTAMVAMKPNNFRVTRSAKMAAPPAEVFAQVNDFHKWEAWSPWAKLDPNAKNSFEGNTSGEGAIFRWAGNSEVGEGEMTITESREPELIRLKLEFIKPMEDTSDTEFTFKPDGDHTNVTWTMSGTYKTFMSKAMCTLMNMDKMVGGQFEKGLASMKAIVERDDSAEKVVSTQSETKTEQ